MKNIKRAFRIHRIFMAQEFKRMMEYKGDFLVYGLSDLKKCNYTMEGNQAVIAEELAADSSYYIFVTEKTTILDKILTASSKKMQLNGSKDDQKVFLIKMSPILYALGLTDIDIYYSDQNDDEKNIAMEKRAVKLYNLKESDKINFSPVTVDEIQKKYEYLHNTIPKLETKDGVIYKKDSGGNLLLMVDKNSDFRIRPGFES